MKNLRQTETFEDDIPQWRYKYTLKPESGLRVIWEILIGLFLLFLGFLVPYTSAFDYNDTALMISIDLLSLALFSFDIILNFNTGYYFEGQIIIDRVKITKNYLKFWFWLDMFSTIPIDWILNFHSSNTKILTFLKFLRILKFIKLIRLTRLQMLIFRLEDQIANEKLIYLITVLKLLLYLFLIGHFFACMMFFISSSSLSPTTMVYEIETKSDEEVTSNQEFYVSSLYWAFVTMASIGYGDYSPENTEERIFGVFTMLTSSVLFGVIIGNIGTLIEKYNMKNKERSIALVNLNCLMKKYKIDSKLMYKARRFIDFAFHYDKYNEENLNELLSSLSQPLQEEILLCTNGKIIHSCKNFFMFSDTYINKLAKLMQIKIFSPLDVIITEGQSPIGMYFIIKGIVEVFDLSTSCRIIFLSNSSYFGEIGLFTRQNCVSSVFSSDFSENLFLGFSEFDALVQLMPNVKVYVEEVRKSCNEGNYSALGVNCYSCKQLGHIAKHCQAILNDESVKEKWLDARQKSKKVNIYEYKKIRYKRLPRKVKRNDYSKLNVLGKKRKVNQMFPKIGFLLKGIKHYFQNNIKVSDSGSVLHTEESFMNSFTFKASHPEWILSSSDEEIYETQLDKFNPIYDI